MKHPISKILNRHFDYKLCNCGTLNYKDNSNCIKCNAELQKEIVSLSDFEIWLTKFKNGKSDKEFSQYLTHLKEV